MRLLNTYELREPSLHTALDDLESFFWLLMWGIVHASKDIDGAKANNRGIQLMINAWSGGLESNSNKLTIAERRWKDAVFGSLIKEWLVIFRNADQENERITGEMSSMDFGDKAWNDACNELEAYCKETYEDLLKSGLRHLEEVKRYSDWEAVVAANSQRANKKRRFE